MYENRNDKENKGLNIYHFGRGCEAASRVESILPSLHIHVQFPGNIRLYVILGKRVTENAIKIMIKDMTFTLLSAIENLK